MHPIASHQIASLRAEELRRQAARHNAHGRSAHGRPRPVTDGAEAPPVPATLRRVWQVLARRPRPA